MKKYLFVAVFYCFSLLFFVQPSNAQLEYLDGYQDKLLDQDQGPGAKKVFNDIENITTSYIYETPTMKALSHLYWAVNLYDISDNLAVDEFMRFNECDIYRNFSGDEIEWGRIRDAGRNFILENKNDFPTRFEFLMPIKLKDYDTKRRVFQLQDDFVIDSLRRFEVYAIDFRARECNDDISPQEGYPRSLILEFSRPFTLESFAMEENEANDYIKRKQALFRQKVEERWRNKERMYSFRDAYLAIKVKIFTHGKFMGLNMYQYPVVQMMAVLEGYEIYEDPYKEKLFFSESYVSNKNKGKLDIKLQDEYDILTKRSQGRGILHEEEE